VAADFTPEQLAMLERQREYLCSDDHIRREVEPWIDASPEERLIELARMCEASQFFLAGLAPEALERALRAEPLPPDSEAIFLALRQQHK
jgi:hypothetical protein